ncbi:MAG: thioredoxin domain-containing protein [Nitrospinae bacterium]|nr:thioredoxin domain-containing protein [Nitrospinota bacterium]
MGKLPDGGFNRLRNEKSPYLLQHAENPVHWFPWGDEAFARAASDDKPVFLSIGYSTCHWCHVMAHESFEDAEVARLLNKSFIAIKVDREERPDIDAVYMKACHLLSGTGGWPLNLFLTPDKRPFFGGTYFPKNARMGRAGMMELLPAISVFWREKRGEADKVAAQLAVALSGIGEEAGDGEISTSVFHRAYEELAAGFDPLYGGFSNAPKFPVPHTVLFLLRHWRSTGEAAALAMARKTLEEMRKGGIYDHLGFGFHRYSTDRLWLVPHFEKMLYDQALLAMAYTEGFQATGEPAFARTAREIFSYCQRDMSAPEGGFFSGEDADSEGEEGKYYVWSMEELTAALGEDSASFAARAFNVRDEGNYIEETTGRPNRRNILHLEVSRSAGAEKMGMTQEEFDRRFETAREKLFAARAKRARPFRDDKVLTDWNGLMIVALAKAARAFDEPAYTAAARRTADFIISRMMKNGGLLHRFREGEAAIEGMLDDYAFFVWGLIELYEDCFDPRYLQLAVRLNDEMLNRFWDTAGGGLFLASAGGEELIARPKELHDGAIPSGNSVALMNLTRLHRLTGSAAYAEKAELIARAFGETVGARPSSYCHFLCGYALATGPVSDMVIVCGEPADAAPMLKKAWSGYAPERVVLVARESETAPGFPQELKCIDGKPTAYVCRDFACSAPTADIDTLMGLLA